MSTAEERLALYRQQRSRRSSAGDALQQQQPSELPLPSSSAAAHRLGLQGMMWGDSDRFVTPAPYERPRFAIEQPSAPASTAAVTVLHIPNDDDGSPPQHQPPRPHAAATTSPDTPTKVLLSAGLRETEALRSFLRPSTAHQYDYNTSILKTLRHLEQVERCDLQLEWSTTCTTLAMHLVTAVRRQLRAVEKHCGDVTARCDEFQAAVRADRRVIEELKNQISCIEETSAEDAVQAKRALMAERSSFETRLAASESLRKRELAILSESHKEEITVLEVENEALRRQLGNQMAARDSLARELQRFSQEESAAEFLSRTTSLRRSGSRSVPPQPTSGAQQRPTAAAASKSSPKPPAQVKKQQQHVDPSSAQQRRKASPAAKRSAAAAAPPPPHNAARSTSINSAPPPVRPTEPQSHEPHVDNPTPTRQRSARMDSGPSAAAVGYDNEVLALLAASRHHPTRRGYLLCGIPPASRWTRRFCFLADGEFYVGDSEQSKLGLLFQLAFVTAVRVTGKTSTMNKKVFSFTVEYRVSPHSPATLMQFATIDNLERMSWVEALRCAPMISSRRAQQQQRQQKGQQQQQQQEKSTDRSSSSCDAAAAMKEAHTE